MTTERARAVPNAMHTHATAPGSLSTTDFAASVYAATGTVVGINPDDTANGGLATTVARGDHRHAAPCAAPGNIAPDDAAAEGNSTSLARANHVHGFACATAAALTKTATASEGVAVTSARSDHVHATSALPWGVVGRFVATASGSGFTASATTDFSIAGLVVDVTRLYKVYLHSRWSIGGGAGHWEVNFHVGGTVTERVKNLNEAAATDGVVDAAFLWEPASATVTVDIRVVEVSGASTLTFVGAAAVRRWFWVEDIGPR